VSLHKFFEVTSDKHLVVNIFFYLCRLRIFSHHADRTSQQFPNPISKAIEKYLTFLSNIVDCGCPNCNYRIDTEVTVMILNLSDLSSEPLYGQILRQIRARILSGYLPGGEAIPSIRDLARSHRIGIVTVQKAYDDLVLEGLLVARRGKGYFVADLGAKDRAAIAKGHCEDKLRGPIRQALLEGVDPLAIKSLAVHLVDEAYSLNREVK
jgi:GntR family transcriptional regulator